MVLTVKLFTREKVDRMRKAGELWKRRGQVIDEVIRTAPFEGEREIYQLAAELAG
jgi:hypothetical protein